MSELPDIEMLQGYIKHLSFLKNRIEYDRHNPYLFGDIPEDDILLDMFNGYLIQFMEMIRYLKIEEYLEEIK